MKVLLDENLPMDLRHLLSPHEAVTVKYMGWRSVRNGELLTRAAHEGFEALITMDTGIQFQHNLSELPLSIVVLRAPSTRIESIRPLIASLLITLELLQPRSLVYVTAQIPD
jgi:predicted nuclease of predicted toxin-antitoxin system